MNWRRTTEGDPMEFRNIIEYRVQAEKCFRRSELTTDRDSKLLWLTLVEAWLLLSDNITKQDVHETFGFPVYRSPLNRRNTRH